MIVFNRVGRTEGQVQPFSPRESEAVPIAIMSTFFVVVVVVGIQEILSHL